MNYNFKTHFKHSFYSLLYIIITILILSIIPININNPLLSNHGNDILGCDIYSKTNSNIETNAKANTINNSATEKSVIPSEINNIVIFVKFSDESEFITDARSDIVTNAYNGLGKSLKTYIEELTYNQSTVTSTFYPRNASGGYMSYTDSNPRNYYKKKSLSNPIGYSNSKEMNSREDELIINAAKAISNQIDIDSSMLDADNDGSIDNITYIINGLPESFGDLLWSHKSNTLESAYIKDKKIFNYNLLMQGTNNVGVMGKYKQDLGLITHEFLHTFNFPDLYRYSGSSRGENPIGIWDIMAKSQNDPQLPLAYTRLKYGQSKDNIPAINIDGSYELSPSNSANINDTIAYKISSPLSKSEYFIVEYRKGDDKWDSVSLSNKPGLLIYRIDEKVSYYKGNKDGYPDHIYIFRPDATSSMAADGRLNDAIISPLNGQTSFGDKEVTNTFNSSTIHFQDGTNSGIEINNISISDNGKLKFDVIIPKSEGTGSQSDPFIIRTASQFNSIRNNIYSHFKLADNIDMTDFTEFKPIENFYGSIDGNGYTVNNLTINKPNNTSVAIFDILDESVIIKNIYFQNINVHGNRMVSTIAVTNNGVIDNVEIHGSVTANEDWASGIAQSNMLGGIISNSVSNVTVTGQDYLGGITANNYGGIIKNSINLGAIKLTSGNLMIQSPNIGAVATRNYETESTIENVFWDVNSSNVSKAVAVGDGLISKGTIGLKLNKSIIVDELKESFEEIELIGYESDIINSNILLNKINSNSNILTIKPPDTINLNIIRFGIIAEDPAENVKIYYNLNIGKKDIKFKYDVTINKIYEDEDVNKDKTIDILDLSIAAILYNTKNESPNWNNRYDINKDNIIDILDLVRISKCFVKS